MRDLDLTTLRLFVSVCETRNIVRAGEQAHIVSSAISKRLAQLEEALGTPLLVRGRRGVEPTPAGETLLEHARAMLAGAARIERDIAAYTTGTRGIVRVLATTSMMAESLAADVADFLKQPGRSGIQVNMEERVSRDVIRGLEEGSASLGFCWDITELGELRSRPYRDDHLAVVMHPSHPLAQAPSLRFAQALEHPMVSMPEGSAIQKMLEARAAEAGKPLVQPVVVESFDAALRVVHANLAMAIIPVEATQPCAAAFGLRIAMLDDAWARRRFVVCFREERLLTLPAKMLLDHLAPA